MKSSLRDQGRNTVGGVGNSAGRKNDHVCCQCDRQPDGDVAGLRAKNGIGKRTPFDDYRKQSRGGKGIITMKTGDKTGNVVGALHGHRYR